MNNNTDSDTRHYFYQKFFKKTTHDRKVLEYGKDFIAKNARFRLPFMVVTNKNTIIAGASGLWNGFTDFNRSYIVIKRSTDNGLTWGNGIIILDNNAIFLNDAHGSRVVNSCPVVVGNRIFVFMSKIDDETAPAYWGIVLSPPDYFSYFGYVFSDDDGLTWSAYQDLSAFETAETNLLAPSPTSGIILSNGTIVIPVLDHRHSANTFIAGVDWGIRSLLVYSTDGGATWNKSINEIPSFTDECSIVEYKPNEILLISRSVNNNYRVWTTSDLGTTWVQSIYDRAIGGITCQCGLYKYTNSGITKFLMTFPHLANPSRQNVVMDISDDGFIYYPAIPLWLPISQGYTSIISNPITKDLYFVIEENYNLRFLNLNDYIFDIIYKEKNFF
jgi:hypothetical protein